MPRVRIIDSDESFAAEDGETILSAAQRAGVPFAYNCQAGNCGSCKCELVAGDIFELEYSEYALAPAERSQSLILACRTQVWGDTEIRRIDAEELVVHPSRVLACRVASLEWLTHDIRQVVLEIVSGGPFAFSAGQYAQVAFAPALAKHYSMANRPDDPLLEFHVRRMPNGRCSAYVADHLNVGDAVTVRGPHGVAYLREHHEGPVVLMAGGSGLAPMLSILRRLLAVGRTDSIRLFFGVRTERDIYAEAALQACAAAYSRFQYDIVLSESMAGRYPSGLVHAFAERHLRSVEQTMAYLAGPPVMVEAAAAMLKDKGLAQRSIHADAYYDQP